MTVAKLPVAIAGATGLVGQQFVRLLGDHPWFEVSGLMGSARSAGRRYGEVVDWALDGGVPERIGGLTIRSTADGLPAGIVFSALPASVALVVEPLLAARGHLVCSNASAFRLHAGVPLVIPEVNGDAMRQLASQPWARHGGGIVTNPNCVVAGLALVLAPLQRAFGLRAVTVSTMQALSGAGLRALRSTDGMRDVIPHIAGEEEKIAAETAKILGGEFAMSVAVHRVAVRDGHTASVFVRTRGAATVEAVERALRDFLPGDAVAQLPSAPARPLYVCGELDRPRPALDLGRGGGMTVSVGRVRSDARYDAKFTLVVHNTVRGAAGTAVLNAELAATGSWIPVGPNAVGSARWHTAHLKASMRSSAS